MRRKVPAAPSATTRPVQIGFPFWPLMVQCVNLALKSKLPKGTMWAGTVWVFELSSGSASLRNAMKFLYSAVVLKVSSVGKLPVGRVG